MVARGLGRSVVGKPPGHGRPWGAIGRSIATHVVLLSGGVLMLLPFFWMISTSLKHEWDAFQIPPQWIPRDFVWENYTNALFGSFTTVAAPATAVTLVDTFTLTITQTAPGPGSLVFTSTVGGSIFLGNSQAFVQFNTPLTRTITSGGFTTSYRIVEGDDANPGRLELFGNPGQVSTLNGEIGIVAIPEPGTMALACAALPLLGLGYVRRRRQMAKV